MKYFISYECAVIYRSVECNPKRYSKIVSLEEDQLEEKFIKEYLTDQLNSYFQKLKLSHVVSSQSMVLVNVNRL